MKHAYLSIAIALTLAACAATTPAGQVATFTATDLNNAIVIDKANNNTEKLTCDSWVLSQLTLIQSQAAAATPITGIFSAGSAADSATTNILTALGPTGQQAFEQSCGPWALHLAGTVSGFKALAASAPGVVAALGVKP